jgi:5-methyltetrahydrofolate--homocysteine methyltransferase
MAISQGMTSAITNPLHADVKQAIQAADVLMGHDPDCAAWIRVHRDPTAGAETGGRRGGRRARVGDGR